jgi:putative effector of murein hydrolase LrgA (UPF0299 family)
MPFQLLFVAFQEGFVKLAKVEHYARVVIHSMDVVHRLPIPRDVQ